MLNFRIKFFHRKSGDSKIKRKEVDACHFNALEMDYYYADALENGIGVALIRKLLNIS